MHEKPKNREWVKNAAIIFLAVLLVLTFFSNTIMNRSLPEVATQEVTDGSIVARVRGTGTVTANSNSQVKMEKTRVIRSVLVKVGQEVQAGDVLFTLGEGSSEDIEAAEEKLRELQTSYSRTAATMPQYKAYAADWNRLSHLSSALNEAKKAFDAAEKAAKMAATNKTQWENAEKERDSAIERRNAAKKLYDKLLKKLSGKEYSSEELKELQRRQKNILQQLRDNDPSSIYYAKEIEELYIDGNHLISNSVWNDSYYAGREKIVRQITLTERAITELRSEIGDEEDPDSDLGLGDQDGRISEDADARKAAEEEAARKAEEEKKAAEEEAARKAEEEKKAAEEEAARKAEEEKKAAEEEAARKAEEEKKAAEEEAARKAEEEKKAAEEEAARKAEKEEPKSPQTGNLEEELEARKKQLTKLKEALEDYDALQTSIDGMWASAELVAAREAYDAAVLEVEKWEKIYEILIHSNNTPQSEAYKDAKRAYEYAQEEYYSAKEALDEKILSDQQSIAGYNIDLADTWQQIEKAKEKLADLTGGEEAQILARISGIVESIECAPGDTVPKDEVLCTIESPDLGYTLSFSVTNDQASRLRPGDTATVSNFYWGTEIVATLNSIKTDSKNPQTNKLLTFDLSGNVTAGSELTISVGQKSATFDLIIPSSAIRTDANGSFVLKVESKNSPLGNRYIARRVPVEVLASDDTNSAVSADLSYGDYVITTSSAPIKSGELVRLATA